MADEELQSTDVDLRGDLSAAFDAYEADPGTVSQPAGTNAQPAERPASAPATPTPEQQAAAAQRARDEQGRFSKEQAPKPTTEAKAPGVAAEPGQTQTIAPPATWTPAAKAKFAALDPEVQQEVLRREKDIEQGKAQWDQKAERFNRLDAVLGPRQEFFRLRGIDETQAVAALLAAQDLLERDPVQALHYLGQQRGVNWQALFQRVQGGGGPQQAQLPPGMEPFARQLQSLTQTVTQQQHAAASAAQAVHQNEVQSFAADPKNIYFENVRADMGHLLRSGQAATLAQAYEKACWSRDDVRPLMMQASEQQRQADAKAAAAQKVAQARSASGSVTGSPTPGASPNGAGPRTTLRDDLSAAWDAAA